MDLDMLDLITSICSFTQNPKNSIQTLRTNQNMENTQSHIRQPIGQPVEQEVPSMPIESQSCKYNIGNTLNICHMPQLKRVVKDCIENNTLPFPVILSYCQGIGFPNFKITIEKTDVDFFVDSNGAKWTKE